MKNIEELLQQIILLESVKDPITATKKLKREYAKEHKLAEMPTNTELLRAYRALVEAGTFSRNQFIEKILKKRAVRSLSGIVPIQVLTKPFRCPGECIFCPNDATMPKSYINTEPGAMRALLNQFDPYKQVYNRLLSLYLTGHETDKIEMIVLGGTWDVYPNDYKEKFLKGLYDACNTFDEFRAKVKTDEDMRVVRYKLEELGMQYPDTIAESIKINETSNHRIIGLTIETRPEYMTDENCRMWREWGVTRLEMGLQSMYDDVLDLNKRGHSVQQAREAMHKMRQYGFKFSVHFMPGLYGSTVEKDVDTFHQAYTDVYIKPDEIKFYPTSVIPNTELYNLYKKGEYTPLAGEDLRYIIKETQHKFIPAYTRIKRLIRDIPSDEIVAGSDITNLRQITEREMLQENKENISHRKALYENLYPNAKYYTSLQEFLAEEIDQQSWSHPQDDISEINTPHNYQTFIVGSPINMEDFRNYICLDTRAREMRHRTEGEATSTQLIMRKYDSSVGVELFLSFEDELGYLYGFTRLLLPKAEHTIERDGLGVNTALIRELHVYGQLAKIKADDTQNTAQHKGFGTQLMEAAEQIATQCGYKKISVISGVGVREYYRNHLGYHDEGTYVVKDL